MSLPSVFDYLTREEVAGLAKVADPITHPLRHALGTVAKGALGFGAGTLAGYGLGTLIGKTYRVSTGKELPQEFMAPAGALLGAGMGMAYSLYKSRELEELQRALAAHREASSGKK